MNFQINNYLRITIFVLSCPSIASNGFLPYSPKLVFANIKDRSEPINKAVKLARHKFPVKYELDLKKKLSGIRIIYKRKRFSKKERAFSAVMRFAVSSSPYGFFLTIVTFIMEKIIPKIRTKKKRYSHFYD